MLFRLINTVAFSAALLFASADADAGATPVVIDFEGYETGQVVSQLDFGLSVTALKFKNKKQKKLLPAQAMIFDSALPTGDDEDLGTPNEEYGGPGVGEGSQNSEPLGKVLIISENENVTFPDDNANGGVFTFDFTMPLNVNTIGLLDHEEAVRLEAYSVGSDNPVFTAVAEASNNGVETLNLEVEHVTKLVLTFFGSGAVTHLELACAPIECESNHAKIVMFRVKEDGGKCEEKCVKPSDDDKIADKQDKGYGFCPCEFPVLPDVDPCIPLQCPSDPEKVVMFRFTESDGKCEEKCVKPSDDDKIAEKQGKGFVFCPCEFPDLDHCDPLQCPSDPEKMIMFRFAESKGKCEEKCVKPSDEKIAEKQAKGYQFCPCEDFPPTNDVCDVCGKPKFLAFSYNASVNCLTSDCNSQTGKFNVVEEGTLGDGTVVTWFASEDEKCEEGVYGTGPVSSGGSFGFSTDDKFASNMFICLFGDIGQQIISFHASCSAPIVQGDRFGHLKLKGYNTVPPELVLVEGGEVPCGF